MHFSVCLITGEGVQIHLVHACEDVDIHIGIDFAHAAEAVAFQIGGVLRAAAAVDGEKLTLSYHARYLLDVLRVMDDDRIENMMKFLRSQNFQIILVTPPAKIETIGEYVDTVLVTYRNGYSSIVEEYDL